MGTEFRYNDETLGVDFDSTWKSNANLSVHLDGEVGRVEVQELPGVDRVRIRVGRVELFMSPETVKALEFVLVHLHDEDPRDSGSADYGDAAVSTAPGQVGNSEAHVR